MDERTPILVPVDLGAQVRRSRRRRRLALLWSITGALLLAQAAAAALSIQKLRAVRALTLISADRLALLGEARTLAERGETDRALRALALLGVQAADDDVGRLAAELERRLRDRRAAVEIRGTLRHVGALERPVASGAAPDSLGVRGQGQTQRSDEVVSISVDAGSAGPREAQDGGAQIPAVAHEPEPADPAAQPPRGRPAVARPAPSPARLRRAPPARAPAQRRIRSGQAAGTPPGSPSSEGEVPTAGQGAVADVIVPLRVLGGAESGERVFRLGCGSCHGQTARAISPGRYSARGWAVFFASASHARYAKLGPHFTRSELADAKAYLSRASSGASGKQPAGAAP